MTSNPHWLDFAHEVEDALEYTECPVPVSWNDLEGKRIHLIGNGGSAAIASHIATDIMKFRKVDARVYTDPALMTCFANDYEYDESYYEMLNRTIDMGDALIAISSSGRSENIVQAADFAANSGAYVITLSGFAADNDLRKMGHSNYWVPSNNYGVVEVAHLMLLHSIVNPG